MCSLLVQLLLHITFSKSDHLTQTFCFVLLGLCWDMVNISVSLPPYKLTDIQLLALPLSQTHNVTVCQVMSVLGKANFCASGHSQQWQLCCVIQSGMLFVYNSPAQLFSLSAVYQLDKLSYNRGQFLCTLYFVMCLLL